MQVIGFAGVARVGKSYATNALKEVAEAAGWHVIVLPFAKPLKDEAEARGYGKESNPEEYRKFCQEHGAEMRAQNSNHWLDEWYKMVKDIKTKESNDEYGAPVLVISDDVRYENELAAIRGNSGLVVYLTPGDRVLDEADAEWRKHESEALANSVLGNRKMHEKMFDYFVINHGEAYGMRKWAENFFASIINFPGSPDQVCTCEGCMHKIENRPVDKDQLNKELDDLLDKLGENLEENNDDDDA